MKFSIFCACKKSFHQSNSAPKNRNEPTNAFLDRSSPTLGKKIGPESIEFTDSEIFTFFGPQKNYQDGVQKG